MKSKFFIPIAIVATSCQILAMTLAYPLTLAEAGTNMAVLGKIENKTFFQTTRNDLDWMHSEVECQTFGLEFAQLETKDEFEFMQEKLPMTEIWIGGIIWNQQIKDGNNYDIRSTFEWNDGTRLSDQFSSDFQIELKNGTCIYFYNQVLYPGQCYTQVRKALCQLIL